MYKLLLLSCAAIIVLGCQGTPRYGGGFHEDEKSSIAKPQKTASKYGVNPIEMGTIIDKYIGKPYAGQSQTEKGYDCSGFVGAVYDEYASIHLPRTTGKLWKTGRIVQPGNLLFGDLVFFDTGGKGVSHVGIYIGFNEFAHSSSSNGIIISNLSEKYYRKRYMGARRVME